MEIILIFSKYVKNKIKRIDLLGKLIIFNYNKKGEYFNTSCGGILLLILNVTVIYFGLLRCIELNLSSDTNFSTVI